MQNNSNFHKSNATTIVFGACARMLKLVVKCLVFLSSSSRG